MGLALVSVALIAVAIAMVTTVALFVDLHPARQVVPSLLVLLLLFAVLIGVTIRYKNAQIDGRRDRAQACIAAGGQWVALSRYHSECLFPEEDR
jgi:hypothetical protein